MPCLSSLPAPRRTHDFATRLPLAFFFGVSVMVNPVYRSAACILLHRQSRRTRRQALLELLGLVGVLEHEGVQVALAPDLELGLRRARLAILLYPRRYFDLKSACIYVSQSPLVFLVSLATASYSSEDNREGRTGGILAAADLDEGLDIADFARHGRRLVWK